MLKNAYGDLNEFISDMAQHIELWKNGLYDVGRNMENELDQIDQQLSMDSFDVMLSSENYRRKFLNEKKFNPLEMGSNALMRELLKETGFIGKILEKKSPPSMDEYVIAIKKLFKTKGKPVLSAIEEYFRKERERIARELFSHSEYFLLYNEDVKVANPIQTVIINADNRRWFSEFVEQLSNNMKGSKYITAQGCDDKTCVVLRTAHNMSFRGLSEVSVYLKNYLKAVNEIDPNDPIHIMRGWDLNMMRRWEDQDFWRNSVKAPGLEEDNGDDDEEPGAKTGETFEDHWEEPGTDEDETEEKQETIVSPQDMMLNLYYAVLGEYLELRKSDPEKYSPEFIRGDFEKRANEFISQVEPGDAEDLFKYLKEILDNPEYTFDT